MSKAEIYPLDKEVQMNRFISYFDDLAVPENFVENLFVYVILVRAREESIKQLWGKKA